MSKWIFIGMLLGFEWAQASSNQYSDKEVKVMAYNVENLFDWIHDEGKNDITYLPISSKNNPDHIAQCEKITNSFYKDECLHLDWNEKVVTEKTRRIADTVLSTFNGQGPDILLLEEVENTRVVEFLVNTWMKDAGYQTIALVEGWDKRGIDVAVVSRFPLLEDPILHPIFLPGSSSPLYSRGVLEVRLALPNGEKLRVFANHFPSQANPQKNRVAAINALNKAAATPWDGIQLAGGDFNNTKTEEAQSSLIKNLIEPDWNVSQKVGCNSCAGTHFYRGSWDFLDMLLFQKSLTMVNSLGGNIGPATSGSDWALDTSSIEVYKGGKYQMQRNGTPARFDENQNVGVADHLPILAKLVRKSLH